MSQSKTPKKTTQKILDISLNLFSTYGFESVKMQDIVNKLAHFGLSKGAIYHHFKNKEDILEAILTRYEEGLAHFGTFNTPKTMVEIRFKQSFYNI